MDSVESVNAWLAENHPDLFIREMRTKAGGGYIVEQRIYRVVVSETNPDENGDVLEIEHREEGAQEIFRIKNRLLGSWIADEVRRRDPKFAHIPGNTYHAAWRASLDAELDTAKDRSAYQRNAMESWELAKRNPALMNRFAKRLSAGDKNAWQEFSLENMARHASRHSSKELRSKDFWRALERDSN